MRSKILMPIALGALLIFSLLAASGCAGFGVGQTGPTRTAEFALDYPAGAGTPTLVLSFGAAKLQAVADAEKLLEGTVHYNVVGLAPDTVVAGSRVEIRQTSNVNPAGMINDWDIHLGTSRPIRLEINAGAYEGAWDLGGLPLQELTVNQGASSSTVDFSQPNPEQMSRLVFRTGAASLKLKRLANANFDRMTFDGGASAYTLDFSGRLQRDASVEVKAGLSDLTLIIPADTAAEVIVRQAVTGVNADYTFIHRNDSYVTPAWEQGTRPRLIIDVTMGLGAINLRTSADTAK
jgi:hypothetical protein